MRRDFWAGKRVFVTGHTGFKGSWLTLWLHRLGAEVTGFALAPPSKPSLFERARIADIIESLHGDIRDYEHLSTSMQKADPEVVLHLAAQSLVRQGYRDPLETYSTNVLGTAHVLEGVRHSAGVRAVISVTSDKCYRNQETGESYREGDALGGKDPYSSSKAGAELVTEAYRHSFFSRGDKTPEAAIASARAGNVIGGGDWAADRLIPDFIRGFQTGRSVRIRSPGAVRPWQHVLEPLCGYLDLAEKLFRRGPAFADAWNFGPEQQDAREVSWIADRLVELWNSADTRDRRQKKASWLLDDDTHPPEATYLRLDCSKARSLLGWEPRLPLARALEWTVDWHRQEAAGEDPRRLCDEQITTYEKL